MRIATYNVNGVNARLPVLLKWLEETAPDLVALQELKASQDKFPADALGRIGYRAIWHGQSQWNGVAILSKSSTLKEVRRGLPGDKNDLHSRYIEAEVDGLTFASLYLPNGNPVPSDRFDYKLKWMDRFIDRAADLLASRKPAILAGDFNVIPTDLDVYAPERWRDDALFHVEVRAAWQRLLAQGWIDSLRHMYPEQCVYTFWKYLGGAFERNAGLHIDHVLLSPDLKRSLTDSGVDRYIRALEKTSDHAPLWIELER